MTFKDFIYQGFIYHSKGIKQNFHESSSNGIQWKPWAINRC